MIAPLPAPGLLPSVTYHNQAIYTQPNGLSNQSGQGTGSQPSPIFIANNAVHEYASQAVINEDIGLAQISGLRRADAAAAVAAAEMEIARRGLRFHRNRPLLRTGRGWSETRDS